MRKLITFAVLLLFSSCSKEDYPQLFEYSHIEVMYSGTFVEFGENEEYELQSIYEIDNENEIVLSDDFQIEFFEEFHDANGVLIDRIELISEDEIRFVKFTNGKEESFETNILGHKGLNYVLADSHIQIRKRGGVEPQIELDLIIYKAWNKDLVGNTTESRYVLNFQEAWDILPYFHLDSLIAQYDFVKGDELAMYMPFLVFKRI